MKTSGTAINYLKANLSDIGLLGSNKSYRQVWARDSMICGYGLMACKELEHFHENSLNTLKKYQTKLGKIPHNVGENKEVDPALIAFNKLNDEELEEIIIDSAHSGCIDGNLWYIISLAAYCKKNSKITMLNEHIDAVNKAYDWLLYQDSNECGLLESHEAKDWSDLFSNRYNVLLVNVLWYKVQLAMTDIYELLGIENSFENKAKDIKLKINTLFWYGKQSKDYNYILKNRKEWLYPVKLIETKCVERPFFMPYVAFRDYGDRFDTFGNLAAIIFGLADDEQTKQILDYIDGCGINHPYPVKACYPPINPGDNDWREYFYVRNLNLPNHYHNGGIWPFLGAFYVIALVKAGRLDEARYQLERLIIGNSQMKDEGYFNEWLHGVSGKPMGYSGQSWSCSMYLVAKFCVENEEVPEWI